MTNEMIGKKFGRLTITGIVPREQRIGGTDARRREQYYCLCDCGNRLIAHKSNLTTGRTESCGCLSREIKGDRFRTHGLTKRTENGNQPRIYRTWVNMKGRCYNASYDGYHRYGGRGITVCDEWKNSFEAFCRWSTENGYRDDLTIDRIDVNGNYEPSNCRWITNAEQQKNKRPRKSCCG